MRVRDEGIIKHVKSTASLRFDGRKCIIKKIATDADSSRYFLVDIDGRIEGLWPEEFIIDKNTRPLSETDYLDRIQENIAND